MRPWLFGVARKVAAGSRRRKRDADDLPPLAARDDSIAQRDLLWHALAALDEERRVVLILHDLEGYTGAEIAEMLAIPANTVHSRLRLAREDAVAAIRRLRGGR
jgi:RNA polymerase sigma-70 factor (ECF subfamily)